MLFSRGKKPTIHTKHYKLNDFLICLVWTPILEECFSNAKIQPSELGQCCSLLFLFFFRKREKYLILDSDRGSRQTQYIGLIPRGREEEKLSIYPP